MHGRWALFRSKVRHSSSLNVPSKCPGGDESGSDERLAGDHKQDTHASCSGVHSAQAISDHQHSKFETPPGLDPTAALDVVQHAAAFRAQLCLSQDAAEKNRSAQIPSADIAA